jgi:hypothetical protein
MTMPYTIHTEREQAAHTILPIPPTAYGTLGEDFPTRGARSEEQIEVLRRATAVIGS